jgi:hypothetical protein
MNLSATSMLPAMITFSPTLLGRTDRLILRARALAHMLISNGASRSICYVECKKITSPSDHSHLATVWEWTEFQPMLSNQSRYGWRKPCGGSVESKGWLGTASMGRQRSFMSTSQDACGAW